MKLVAAGAHFPTAWLFDSRIVQTIEPTTAWANGDRTMQNELPLHKPMTNNPPAPGGGYSSQPPPHFHPHPPLRGIQRARRAAEIRCGLCNKYSDNRHSQVNLDLFKNSSDITAPTSIHPSFPRAWRAPTIRTNARSIFARVSTSHILLFLR